MPRSFPTSSSMTSFLLGRETHPAKSWLQSRTLGWPAGAGQSRALRERVELRGLHRCSAQSSKDEGRQMWQKKYRKLLPFSEARRMAQGMGLRGKDDWDEWLNEGKKSPWFGPYMPSAPDEVYPDEWAGWDDFLGVPLPFQEANCVTSGCFARATNPEARKIVHGLKLASQEEWWAYASGGGAGGIKAAAEKAAAEGKGASAVYREASRAATRLRVLEEERKHPNVPARPHEYYKAEWKGYDDWLGLSDTELTFPAKYRQEGSES